MTLSGARIGTPTWVHRIAVRMAARRGLTCFVVPGRDVVLAIGLDLEGAGLRLVATPRHADVLALVGPIPAGLQPACALTYTQMPRPRAILSIGAGKVDGLPSSDVAVAATQADLTTGVARLSALFADGMWAADSGLDHVAGSHDTMQAGSGGGHDMGGMDMGGTQHGSGDMQMGGMDMGGGGFMSMVMMTRDLPRSADGLPMDWLDVPFGPLFPGLPGGFGLKMTLDGDTVVAARVELGVVSRELEASWPGSVDGFVDRFAALDPTCPLAYRLLAELALAATSASAADARLQPRHIVLLERERAASHLRWLATFGFLLGDRWLERRGAALRVRLSQADDAEQLRQVRDGVRAMLRVVRRTPLLSRRLRAVGALEPSQVADAGGPVARAAGHTIDARSKEGAYQMLGFEPVVAHSGDALARLRVRLAELEQSLDLALAASHDSGPPEVLHSAPDGVGQAVIETPRGAATLRLELRDSRVVSAQLASPSRRMVRLVGPVAEARELADALLGIASLDISPWELDA
jgi:Ni,Fe-hydrogenase III large subunit